MYKIKELGGIELLPHPHYSPDLAPSDYYLFRSISLKVDNLRMSRMSKLESKIYRLQAKGMVLQRIKRFGQTMGSNHRLRWFIFQIFILCCVNVL